MPPTSLQISSGQRSPEAWGATIALRLLDRLCRAT